MHLLIEKIKQNKSFYMTGAVNDIFSWQELENLLNLKPFINDKRFFSTNGKSYNWDIDAWSSDINSYPINLIEQLIYEDVCYIQDCSRVNKNINDVCDMIEKVTNSPTDAHIFFSLNENEPEGFKVHYDYSDNFIVQVEGVTNFKVWDIEVTEQTNVDSLTEEPIIDILMNPGDCVYVPAKTWHQAIPKSKRLSISFPHKCQSLTNDKMQERRWIKI